MSIFSSLSHIRLPRPPGPFRSRRLGTVRPDGGGDAPDTGSVDPLQVGQGEIFHEVGEFGGDVLEALIAEAGGGSGGGGDLEFDRDIRRQGADAETGPRDWGPDYGAAGSVASGLDVRTLATRMMMAFGVADGDFGSADPFFDADGADGWSDLLQGDAGPAGGVRFGGGGAGIEAAEEPDPPHSAGLGALPTLPGRGCLPDLGDALAANSGLRDRAAAFSAAGTAGADAGLLTALEDEVTGVLYGWAGLDAAPGDGREAAFLEKYFGVHAAGGIAEALSPDAISEVFGQVRDAAILKLTGQGCLSGLFRDLAYDPKADRLTGSAVIDHDGLAAFGNSAAALGPEGEAGAWQALAALTRGFEEALGEADSLPSLLGAVLDRGADLAGRVGQGLRTLGIDVDSVKLKLPGGDEEETAEASSEEFGPGPQEDAETAETLDWSRHDARHDWSDLGAAHSGERHDAGAFMLHPAIPDMFAFTGMPIFDGFFQPQAA
ncbi:hypothetical protein JL101_007025 [Skermanella rosea]|uniref:hypothetical protein n=1 Tax=Skermanella rosea TaxID=1817965 RepID=UPI001E430F3F|nr:hypothetical protein [Skermanella rosea]UEM05181.1 hypothetical protein JL101_007025 [Skermanella rosea]